MATLASRFWQFWQIVPDDYRHLAPQFWAEEEVNNRYKARYVGYIALPLVFVLGTADIIALPERASILILLNVLLFLSNLVLALNERELLRHVPIHPLFMTCMLINVLTAIGISLMSRGIMQLNLAVFVINLALLVVPTVTIWYALPSIPLALSYILATLTLDLPEMITDSLPQMYVVAGLAPVVIAILNRTAVRQHWQAFLARHDLQEQKVAAEEANRELQKRNEELDAFAHTVAHDLKNPLTIVVGYAEILQDELMEAGDTRLLDYANQVVAAGLKGNKIIQELLLLAAVRKEDIVLSPLQMDGIVTQALERLSHHIEEEQVALIKPGHWPVVMGYAGWVEEVWVNYVSNAIKYGGRPCRVELGATAMPDGMMRFWVRDNGKGLTAEEQAVLFTEFTRLDKLRAKGHGLGLSIVVRIMEKLNGRVGIESIVGEGSTFYFELPIQQTI